MGVGAAATMPVTLSIITTTFPPEERGRAVGVWVGMAGSGAVLGLFGSGVLLHYYPWNSFFVLNVVLAALAFAGTVWIVPASREPDPDPLDVVGECSPWLWSAAWCSPSSRARSRVDLDPNRHRFRDRLERPCRLRDVGVAGRGTPARRSPVRAA